MYTSPDFVPQSIPSRFGAPPKTLKYLISVSKDQSLSTFVIRAVSFVKGYK